MSELRQVTAPPAGGESGAAALAARPERQPLDGFSLGLLVLIVLFVAVATASNLPLEHVSARRNLEEGQNVANTVYLLTRAPREALVVGLNLFLIVGFMAPRYRCQLPVGMLRMLVLILVWIGACAVYTSTVKDLPLLSSLLGVKFLLQTPAFFAGFFLVHRTSVAFVERFASLLRWYVGALALITAVGVVERLASGRPLGVRYVGVFLNPNAYGVTLVACALWFLCANLMRLQRGARPRFGPWILLCMALSVATGSRLASSLTLLALMLNLLPRLAPRLRMLLIGLAPVLLVGALVFVSESGVSRHRVDRSTAKRLDIAEDVVSGFRRPADVVFGFGIGLASPATVIVLGRDEVRGQIGNAHSAVLEIATSFGLGGLLLFLSLFVISLARGPSPQIDFFVLIVGAACLAVNPWGIAPAGALLCMLWGALFAVGLSRRREALAPAG